MFATRTSLRLRRTSPSPSEQHAAGGGQGQDHGFAHEGAEQRSRQRQAALHDQHGPGGEQHAPAEHGGERERGDEVEGALQREQPVIAGDPILQRTQNRERPDAKQQTGRHERPAHRAPTLGEATLQGIAKALERSVYAQELADDETQDHAHQRHERVVEAQEALDADEDRDEPDGVHGRLPHPLRKPRADQSAQGASGQHSHEVDRCSSPDHTP